MITHLAIGVVPAALFAPRYLVPVAVGAVLPDATGRVPQILLAKLGSPFPDPVTWMFDVVHQPLAQGLIASMLALGFRPEDQRRVWVGLLIGIALHFGLDILQDHHGQGYMLLFPLSVARFELGWIGSEATVHVAPWMAIATGVAVAWRLTRARR